LREPELPNEEDRRRRNRYIWRTWVLGSVPVLLAVGLWLAWDYRLSLREVLSLRFLAVLGAGLAASSIAGYFLGRLFWKHGLAPDDDAT